jgi:hypothetical protein
MQTNWTSMRDKMTNISAGLLRFNDIDGKVSMPVPAPTAGDAMVVHFDVPANEYTSHLRNQEANLVQKCDGDYLYFTGYVSGTKNRRKNSYHLTMEIVKGHWFVQKFKGSTRWLEEICSYEQLDAAS